MTTITRDFSYRNEHFTIVFDGRFYMTVNHKLIGADGHPVKTLTYADGLHTGTTVAETINLTKNDLDIQFYEAQGMSKAEAFSKVMNVPLEMAQMLYN